MTGPGNAEYWSSVLEAELEPRTQQSSSLSFLMSIYFLEAECVCQDGEEGWKSGDGTVLASSYRELIVFGLPSKYSLPWENTNRMLQDWTIPAPAVMLPTPSTPEKPVRYPSFFFFLKALYKSTHDLALDRCLLPLYPSPTLSPPSPLLSAVCPVPAG